jgi:hypothetical protein
LVETPQGKWLEQSCRDSLYSEDYSWPNAIALKKAARHMNMGSISWEEDIIPEVIRPNNEELDPRDQGRRWVAVLGNRLQTRPNLTAVPCGNGKQCAYGYGAISAPALLQYEYLYDFGAIK